MDKTTKTLVDYARTYWSETPPQTVFDAALNHLVDTAACIIAGYSTPPAQIATAVARTMSSDRPATVFGAGLHSAPAYAVFANTVMVRTLDWNDGMLAPGGGHPSDMIPAVLAAGEINDSSGSDVLKCIILAYEALGSLGAMVDRLALHIDQGLFMGVATASAIGMLHGLDDEQLANAMSLSLVPAIPLNATRRGSLSMWKGAATAAATTNATNAVAYAQAGLTAPGEPFDGNGGLKVALTGPFDLTLPAYPGGKAVIELSHQKMFPAESHSQALLALVPKILEWSSLDQIESIHVDAYQVLYVSIGRDPSVWDPQTRESADHSLPYLLAVAMVDGRLTPASFAPERIADPALRPIMAKIRITENPEYTAQYRPPGMELAGSPKLKIVVRNAAGDEFAQEVTYPKGHSKNPMSRDDINKKLDVICDGVIPDPERDQIRDAWWNIEKAENVRTVISTLADFGLAAFGRSSR